MISNKLSKILLVTSFIYGSLVPVTLHAATGSTAVTVEFPEIIVLHYRSSLNIKFTGASDIETDEGTVATINLPLSSASGDGTISLTGAATTVIPVDIANMWAVRGITSSGNFKIDAAVTNDTASSGTSEVVMDNLEADASGSTGASITVPSAGLAQSNAVIGGINFDLDITDVTKTGIHSGIAYTITASAP